MAKLLGVEQDGHRTHKYWQHTGDDGEDRITVETVEDVEPVFKRVKETAQNHTSRDFRYKAEIPMTLLTETCKINANLWGITTQQAFAEMISAKTDRAKRSWKTLTEGRDFSKLQARTYVP